MCFCLKNQTTREAVVPTMSSTDSPTEPRSSNGQPLGQHISAFSPFSQESETGVTAYANAVVQRMEQIQEDDPEVAQHTVDVGPKEAETLQSPNHAIGSSGTMRSGTPILSGGEDDTEADVDALEIPSKCSH